MKNKQVPETTNCLVVGGCANGAYLRGVKTAAELIRLDRSIGVKPLKSSTQKQPEIEKESEVYRVYPVVLYDPIHKRDTLFSVAVPEEQSLDWGFTQLMLGFMQNAVKDLENKPTLN